MFIQHIDREDDHTFTSLDAAIADLVEYAANQELEVHFLEEDDREVAGVLVDPHGITPSLYWSIAQD